MSKKYTKLPETKSLVRSRGRRSDPNYTGAFAYIPTQLHEDVRRELFGRKDLDFSGLVEQLLADWLEKQQKKIKENADLKVVSKGNGYCCRIQKSP